MTIELLGLHRNDWERVAADPEVFANEHQLAVGAQRDLLRGVAEQTLALFQRTGVTTQPWSGFLSVDREHNTIVGTCCFVAPPDDEGVVEIAYFTFPGFEGRGVARDDTEAVRLYRQAAAQGLAMGQSNLGFMYAEGRGVAKDETEAVRLFQQAAAQGYALGQYGMGLMYEQGWGVARDLVEGDAAVVFVA